MTKKPAILLVDDVEANLVALQGLLASSGADVICARTGPEALECLLVREVAVALIDVQMPGMGGFELAELIRGSERTRGVPIIFITAGPRDQHRAFAGYEAGGVDFLYKPLDPDVLRWKVAVFLQLWEQKQKLAGQLEALHEAQAQLRDADRRKDEFLAVLSHELRNPLTPVRNSVHLLQRMGLGEQAGRYLGIIDRQVRHLARLVDDLLDVTRIASAKVQLQRERLDLCEALRKSVEDQKEAFDAAGVSLEVSLPSAPLWAVADPTRVAQIAGNLLANAIKFTPRGGRVWLELTAEEGDAVLRVRDDGVGMSAETLQRIFVPFAQAERTLDRSRGGLGLGLALVKGMVQLHGGAVTASSEGPGRGSEFVVRLPRAAASAGEERADRPGLGPGRRRVLVIEDNEDTAETLCEALSLMGHEVELARDGARGIDRARQMRPDVVLCDIGLPGIDGYEVARRLRADPSLQGIELVAISGYALPEDRRRAVEAGFTRHVSKPADLDEIGHLLASAPSSRGRRPP